MNTDTETKDLTQQERYDIIAQAFLNDDNLKGFDFHFKPTKTETFGPYNGYGYTKSETYRQHYIVSICRKSDKRQQSFEYSTPHKSKAKIAGDIIIPKSPVLTPEEKQERLVSFLWCIYQDYTTVTDYGFLDCFDFMDEFGYEDAREANKVWEALKDNTRKLRTIFGYSEFEAIKKATENY